MLSDDEIARAVESYLDRLGRAVAGLPAPLRAQVLEGVASHIADALAEGRPVTESDPLYVKIE